MPEGRFKRWSAAKAEARRAAAEPAPVPAAEAPVDADAYLEAEGLAAPETLEQGDDFARFMQEGVPSALRRRALRRLWATNPALANLDGLIDYGDDFTDAAMVPKVISTAYEVGRGMLRPPPEEVPEDAPAQAPTADEGEAAETVELEEPQVEALPQKEATPAVVASESAIAVPRRAPMVRRRDS
ncbi:MAG: DUF3306 domain-containing protein [Pseudomonadota bacterium]